MKGKIKRILCSILTLSLLLTLFATSTGSSVQAAIPVGENLIHNGDMESMLGEWNVRSGDHISTVSEPVHSGNFATRIAIDDDGGGVNPFMTRYVDGLLPNTEYVYSAWVKVTSQKGQQQAVIPVEAFTKNADGTRTYVTIYRGVQTEDEVPSWDKADGEWHKIVNRFTTGPEVNSVNLFARMYASEVGTEMFIDDASLVQVGEPVVGAMDTDQWIYYSDYEEDGVATVQISEYFTEIQQKGTVDFAFKDGEKVLKSETVNANNGIATFSYPMSFLTQKQHEYIVEAVVKDIDGTVKDTFTRRVFKYDRPNYVSKDGTMIKNGKRVYPYWAASSYIQVEQYSDPIYEAGIKMIPAGAFKNAEEALAGLNLAQEKGMMCLLIMYYNVKCPAHPDNVEKTIEVVNAVKDHPALFAYSIMDEASGRADVTDDMMIDSYRLIRDIDPNHPIYQTENMDFVWGSKTSDILGLDPYGRPESKNAAKNTLKAVNAVKNDKPVISMIQAFKQGDGSTTYFPEPNEGRLTLYQALLAGAKGLSFYGFATGGLEEGKYLDSTPLWPALVEFELKDKELMYDHFIFGDTPVFNREFDLAKNVWYHSFVKGNDIYMIVTNSATTEANVSVPLTSYNGITINGYKAVVHSGSEDAPFTSYGSTLDVALKPNTAVVYKITPYTAPDYSSLTKDAYEEALAAGLTSGKIINVELNDLEGYDWAKAEIETICEMGIANLTGETTFSPGTNITRGDFAMFLIRTLNLQSDSTENFADVDVNAYYAKELAIGKALGVLNGIGDNVFNPYAEISRQDMMTICARGMYIAKKLGWEGVSGSVTGFSDSELISDYAMESVATMVREGIVKGNPEGTINPLGNTTRAEASVIMYRILNK